MRMALPKKLWSSVLSSDRKLPTPSLEEGGTLLGKDGEANDKQHDSDDESWEVSSSQLKPPAALAKRNLKADSVRIGWGDEDGLELPRRAQSSPKRSLSPSAAPRTSANAVSRSSLISSTPKKPLRRIVFWFLGFLVALTCLSELFALELMDGSTPLGYVSRRIFLFVRDIGYLTRPLWDTPPRGFASVITHYNAPHSSIKERCKMHGWTLLEGAEEQTKAGKAVDKSLSRRRRVFDAFIFNNELDLLDVRLMELMDVVDYFVIMESNTTFSGKAKPTYFNDNKDRYAFASHKILHNILNGEVRKDGESPWMNERMIRDAMTQFLASQTSIQDGDLLIMSDADELPSAAAIDLLRSCDGPPFPLTLDLKNFLYSFEFEVQPPNRAVSVHSWETKKTLYRHGSAGSNALLLDSGWHCSFCFRYLSDFVLKMKGYSHNDRVTSPQQLDPKAIQKKICEGRDLFDMYPEVFTFHHLLLQLNAFPSTKSAFYVPEAVARHSEKFAYLLPGYCKREREGKGSLS